MVVEELKTKNLQPTTASPIPITVPRSIPRLFSFQVSSFSLLMALAARQAVPPFGSRIRVIYRTASQQFGSGSS
jgi:hypothetical protein